MNKIVINKIEYRFYDHLYAVSKEGIFLRNLLPYTPTHRKDGYLNVGRKRLAHRVVATCWLDNPDNLYHVHHRNKDKSDNRASNLEWISPKKHSSVHKSERQPYTRTPEIKEKIRQSRLGKTTSEETKQKQRDASVRLGLKPPPRKLGEKCTPEAKQKMRDNSPNAVRCMVDGIMYPSYSVAGEALNIKPQTLRKRCYSINFPSYKIIKP